MQQENNQEGTPICLKTTDGKEISVSFSVSLGQFCHGMIDIRGYYNGKFVSVSSFNTFSEEQRLSFGNFT